MIEISIIIPCYNEENTITLLLDALRQQTYPVEKFEIVIADGMSEDGTREKIRVYERDHPEMTIKVVENKKRVIPAALNLALQASNGDVIIRLDGHSVPAKDYVEKCIQTLETTKAANVGGRWEIQAAQETWMAKSIAAAAANPIGVGDALYRYSESPGEVDTVPFGAYHKGTIQNLGGYDESLLANEDYELNVRIRKNGGTIWFNPAIRSIYFTRATFKELAIQYYRYGFWKAQMLKRYPETVRWRQALPPIFLLSVLFFLILTIFTKFGWVLLVAELIVYVVILSLFSIRDSVKRENPKLIYGEPLAIATMHSCWGFGFLAGLFKVPKKP